MTDAQRMIDLLRYANLSKVARAIGVSKSSTSQWAKGLEVTPHRLRQVEDLLRPQRASEGAAATEELMAEMRAIRQLLMRQQFPTTEEIVKIALETAAGAAIPSQSSGVARPRKRATQAEAVK